MSSMEGWTLVLVSLLYSAALKLSIILRVSSKTLSSGIAVSLSTLLSRALSENSGISIAGMTIFLFAYMVCWGVAPAADLGEVVDGLKELAFGGSEVARGGLDPVAELLLCSGLLCRRAGVASAVLELPILLGVLFGLAGKSWWTWNKVIPT